jgi:hypothetical protein
MKRNLQQFLAAALSVTAVLFTPAFQSSVNGKPQSVSSIQSIRRQYAAINKHASRYRQVKKELSGFSLEGGELVAYFDGPAIVKLVAKYYGESGQALEEYYFKNEQLIFVFRKESTYNRPLSGKVVRSAEDRFYFANDRLIQWLNNSGRPAPNGIADYQQKQNEYLETARKFAAGARSKAATIEY